VKQISLYNYTNSEKKSPQKFKEKGRAWQQAPRVTKHHNMEISLVLLAGRLVVLSRWQQQQDASVMERKKD
jgi:hypothetical protein